MRKIIDIPPPSDFVSFSPSELFRFFFQLGRWTEESFSDDFQAFTHGKLISTVTLSKWKNKDVVPARYSGPLLKMIESSVSPIISSDWVKAFETVWAHHSSGRPSRKFHAETSTFSDQICTQHRKWIDQLYQSPVQRDTAPPSMLYVPLQLYDVNQDESVPQSVEFIFDPKLAYDWTFISGGPGSGKSMAALHLANLLSQQELFPIYLRGSRLSTIDIDVTDPDQLVTDSFSIKSFLKHFRASSFQSACLIFDGIDEISHTSHVSFGSLNQFLSDLKTEQAACAAHDKNFQVIILGRDSHIQIAKSQSNSVSFRHYKLLALDGSYRERNSLSTFVQGEDLRELWWTKYLEATGNIPDPSLPDFLTTEYDDFSEFGTDPLLATLICKTALGENSDTTSTDLPHERVNALTYTSNKNDIYNNIVEQIASSDRHNLDPSRFVSVLQQIAISAWQNGDNRSVSLATAYANIDDENIKAAFQTLSLSQTAPGSVPDMLMTAFFYQLYNDKETLGESVFEFTHKTFSEYLISTCLFDAFTDLITTIDNHSKFEKALRHWIRVSHSGPHEPGLGDFCQKEATTRYENLSNFDWTIALNIIENNMNGFQFVNPKASSISHIQNSASLLFFIWSCLNSERQKRGDQPYQLSQDEGPFTIHTLKSIHRRNGLDFKLGSRLEPVLRDQSFLTQSLSGLKLNSADMSQLSFSLGHMENLVAESTSFAMTHWSHVKTTDTSFSKSVFQQAIFHQWRILNSRFDNCFFQGARFQGANFLRCHFNDTFFSQCHFSDVDFTASDWSNVTFDRCVFAECVFQSNDADGVPDEVEFRHCTFVETEQDRTPFINEQKIAAGLEELF